MAVVADSPRRPHALPLGVRIRRHRIARLDLHPLSQVRRPRLGRPGGADRDDQARVRRRRALDQRGVLQEAARRLPGAAGARGPRALRLLRAPAGRQARRLPRRARLHAAGLRPHARLLDPLRRGQPRRSSRPALLRPHRRRRGAGRPGAGPARRHLHHRRAPGPDRRRRLRPDPVRLGELRPRPARRRPRLRAGDQRRALAGPGELLLPHPARPGRHRPRDDHRLADRLDLPRGAEGRAAHLRRRLHRDPVPPGTARSAAITG